MNRKLEEVKMYFCKFDCPFKDKNEVQSFIENIIGLDLDDFSIINEYTDEYCDINKCENNLCPLNKFLNELYNVNIIKED